MPNTFQTQSLVERGLAFAWKASEGFADRVSFRNDLVPGAVKNTGYSTTLRRPSYGGTTQAGTAVDYSLPGVTQPVAPAAYDTLTDITLPITVSQRFEYNMQVSMEELTFKLSKEDAMKRFIEPAIVDMRDKINYFVSNLVAQSAGQVINTAANTDFPTKGDQFMQGMLQAKALMAYRKGITGNTQPKTALINPNVITNLGMANAKVYHAGFSSDQLYSKGTVPNLAGFDVYESPLLDVSTVSSLGASITVTSVTLPTVWQPTFTVVLGGLTANVVIPAGTKLKFTTAGGAAVINWAAPSTGADTQRVATFTVTSQVQATAGGAATVVLSECAIATGSYKNITAPIAATSQVTLALPTGIAASSYTFANDAIVLVSPAVDIPEGVVYGKNLKLGGFNIAMIQDRWPGTLQNITKLVCFVGGAVPRPEGIVAVV